MSDINKLVKATRMTPNMGVPNSHLTILDPKRLSRFRKRFFKRGGTKDKFIVNYNDMKNVSGWVDSPEYKEKFMGNIPITPFRQHGLFYCEFSINKKTGLSVAYTDTKAVGNCAYGISFDIESDNSYLFQVLCYDPEYGIASSPFLEFQATEFAEYTGEDAYAPHTIEITNPQGQYKINLRGVINPMYSQDELRGFATDIFQNWCTINHYILEFERAIKLITPSQTFSDANSKSKKKHRKGIQNIGKVYKVVFTDEELERIKRDYNYTQSEGKRSSRWAFYQVKEDYFDRYPERLEQPHLYRYPSQRELEQYLSYSQRGIEEGKMVILILRNKGVAFNWKRDSALLNHEEQVGYVPVTQRLSA